MKNAVVGVVAGMLMLYTPSFGQEKEGKLKLSEIEIQGGIMAVQNIDPSASELFSSYSNQSALVNEFEQEYPNLNNFGGYWVEPNSHMGIKLFFDGKEKKYHQYRFFAGVHYSTLGAGDLYASRIDVVPYDTLTSAQTGGETYVDSITETRFTFDGVYTTVGTDLGAAMDIHLGQRFNFGIGLSYQYRIGIASNLIVDKSVNSRLSNQDNYSSNYDYEYKFERLKSEKFRSNSFHIPLSLDFRLSTKENNWSRLKIRFTANPGLAIMTTPFYSGRVVPLANYSLGLSVGL